MLPIRLTIIFFISEVVILGLFQTAGNASDSPEIGLSSYSHELLNT